MRRAILGLAIVLLAGSVAPSAADGPVRKTKTLAAPDRAQRRGAAPSAAGAPAGKARYDAVCASCHGPGGAGDGPMAAAFPPGTAVRNLVTGPFRYATDLEKVKEIVRRGGEAVGLSPLMPAQPRLTDRDLDDLAAFVVELRQSRAAR